MAPSLPQTKVVSRPCSVEQFIGQTHAGSPPSDGRQTAPNSQSFSQVRFEASNEEDEGKSSEIEKNIQHFLLKGPPSEKLL